MNHRLGYLFNVFFQNGDGTGDGGDGTGPGPGASVGGDAGFGAADAAAAAAGYGMGSGIGVGVGPSGTSTTAPGTGYGTGVASGFGFGNDAGMSGIGGMSVGPADAAAFGNQGTGSLGPSTGSLGPATGSLGSSPSLGFGGPSVGGGVPGFGNVSVGPATGGAEAPGRGGGVAQAGQFGYPTLAQMIANLESGGGNPAAVAANQKLGMVSPTYGQYGPFAHDFGGVAGPPAIANFANTLMTRNPNITAQDAYATYALGHPATFAQLQASHPDYAANFRANAGVPGTTPLGMITGFDAVDPAAAAAAYGAPTSAAIGQAANANAGVPGVQGVTGVTGLRGGTSAGDAAGQGGHPGHGGH